MKKSSINIPNILSLMRCFLVPVFVLSLILLRDFGFHGYVVPAFIYIITGLTDMLDGKIARKYNLVTDFGKFIDPLADKFMVISSMIAILAWMLLRGEEAQAMVFLWLVLIILLRELGVTSLRLVVVDGSGIVVPASLLGKIKTIMQVVCISAVMIEPLLDASITYLLPDYCLHGIYPISLACMVVALIFTVWSGVNYLKAGWSHISSDW